MTLPKVTGSLHLPNLVMDYGMDSFAFSSCTSTIHSAHTGHGNLFKNINEIMSQSCLHTLQRLPITMIIKLEHLSTAFKAFYDLASPASQSHLLLTLPDTRSLHPLWPLERGKPPILGLCTCSSLCLERSSLRAGWFLYKIQVSAQMLPLQRSHP